MPKIPAYMASLDYNPPRGNVAAAGAPGKALAMFGEAVGEFGSSIAARMQQGEDARQDVAKADLAQKSQAAAAEIERANGTARLMAGLHQTITEFDRDTDPETVMDRYPLRIGNMSQEITDAIRSPAARAEVESTHKSLAAVQTAVLRGDSLRRLAAKGRDDLAGNLDLYAETAAGARHPLQHDDAVGLALREIANKAEAGFITAEDADRLELSFIGDVAQRQARRAITADPEGALARLNDGAEFVALTKDTRARLIIEAGRAVRAQVVRRDSEAAAEKRETLIALPGYLEILRDGALPDDDRFSRDNIIATLGEEAGDKTWAEIERAKAFGDVMAGVKWATPDEIDDLIDGGDQTFVEMKLPEMLGGGDKVSAEHLLQLAVARREKQLRDQPADYVLANPLIAELHSAMVQVMAQPSLPPAISAALQSGGLQTGGGPLANLPSQEDRRAATSAYANATLAEQERLGVPEDRRQILPEAMAKEIVTGLIASEPAKADQALRDLAEDWGDDWPRVSAELERAGLPPEHAALAAAENPVARQTLAKVLAIQTDEPGALRAKTGADADGIDDLVYRHTAGPDGRLLSDDHIKLVKLVAYHHARFSEPEEAVRRAVADFSIRDQIDFAQSDTRLNLDELDIQNHVGDDELGQVDQSPGTVGDERVSQVSQSSGNTPVPTGQKPRQGEFGGPRVEAGQNRTVRDIEPKPPNEQPASVITTLRNSRLTQIWRDTLGRRFETPGHPYDGYGASLADVIRGREGYALGRYQMRRDSLVDSGMMTRAGQWTGRHGVYSWQEFLSNPQAQEAVLVDWSLKIDGYIRSSHSLRLDKRITGIKDDITVTASGLAAAIHKEGPGGVREYFRWLESRGWNSRDHQEEMKQMPEERRLRFLAIETRLREFQGIPYKSP